MMFLIVGLVSPVVVQAEDRFERRPIQYSQSKPNNAVSLLQAKLANDEVEWVREKYTGYLRPLLKALGVGIESQTLVFTKTSLQTRLQVRFRLLNGKDISINIEEVLFATQEIGFSYEKVDLINLWHIYY